MTKNVKRRAHVSVLMACLLLVTCFTTACQFWARDVVVTETTANGGALSSASVSTTGKAGNESEAVSGKLEEAISSAILGKLTVYLFGEAKTQGHIILSTTKDASGNTVVYTLASYALFGFENKIFTITSGSGAIPTVIQFSEKDGTYSLLSYTEPQDGDRYSDSIKELFPKELWPAALDAQKSYGELQKQEEEQATAYLKSIGRNAQVSWDPVEKELFRISAAASNALLAMKELGKYPNWIGSREAVENGTRTVYEASQEESSGYSVITFTKKATDGTVLEQYKYKVTGDSVEQMK